MHRLAVSGPAARNHASPSQTRQSISLLQFFTRGDPPSGDDVRAIHVVAAERGGPAVRARDRHLPRDGADVVEQLRAAVRC